MERKKFNRGTITGGIIRIIVSAIGMTIAVIVLSSTIKSWDADNLGGGIFMCFIASIMMIASIYFTINGIKMIIDGKKSMEVLKKGHSENGRIIDLFATEVTENINGCVSNYTIYNLKFEYTNDNGILCENEEQVSEKVYAKLQKRELVPIIVYKERAIFDRKKFENEDVDKIQ